jgi:hypothetical protein
MARAKNEKSTLKRSESQCLQRDLSSVYCNPWNKILDVPEKNRHPTAEWASRLIPLKVTSKDGSVFPKLYCFSNYFTVLST